MIVRARTFSDVKPFHNSLPISIILVNDQEYLLILKRFYKFVRATCAKEQMVHNPVRRGHATGRNAFL